MLTMATQSFQGSLNVHENHESSDMEHKRLPTDSMVTVRLSHTPSLEATGMLGNETIKSQASITMLSDSSSTTSADEDEVENEGNMAQASRRSSTCFEQLAALERPPSINSEQHFETTSQRRPRNGSIASTLSGQSGHLDWDELDKSEERQERDEASDNSTAFLLARLERENNALAGDPKAGISNPRMRSESRPPSIQHIKKLVSEPARPSLRYSMLPSPPPMTELEFWAALVSNYTQTAQRLPTLTTHKIRGGIPPPLRGVTWMSISGARDAFLESEYERLCGESSPFEKLIGKDIGRSFPGVDMFRDPNGEGQKMLGKVLNAFSLWDQEIGYCQGLGFVVGPMLMHMGDKDAFCVLVRQGSLMEHYDLRSCFLPDLSGLHLRIYQFQQLLSQHLPKLTAHLDQLKLEPVYLSQWFLSFFGVTCPLPMLLRIYDVVLTEGASETLMRVALSLMRRNEKKILAATEFEDVMSLLLSRSLWDTYNCNADDLVNDFCGLTGLVTREGLETLEASFKDSHTGDSPSQPASKTGIHSAASGFLGKFWAGSHSAPKPVSQNLSITTPSRPISQMRRTPSKQSMASTLNSIESLESNTGSTSTDATSVSRQISADWIPVKPSSIPGQVVPVNTRTMAVPNKDNQLHGQIETLVAALNDMQREQACLARELQKEREEREEDRMFVKATLDRLRMHGGLSAIAEDCNGSTDTIDTVVNVDDDTNHVRSTTSGNAEDLNASETVAVLSDLEAYFSTGASNKRSSIIQTKHELRNDLTYWKEAYNQELTRCDGLSQKITEQESNAKSLADELKLARTRIQDAYTDKQRLERTIKEFKIKQRKSSFVDSVPETPTSTGSDYSTTTSPTTGLREFKLGRPRVRSISTSSPMYSQASDSPAPAFNKRMSSLGATSMLLSEDHQPLNHEQLLVELVSAKTAETMAKAELEELKGKFDAMRKMMNGGAPSPGLGRASPTMQGGKGSAGSGGEKSPPLTVDVGKSLKGEKEGGKGTPGTGGFFSGWGKRNVS